MWRPRWQRSWFEAALHDPVTAIIGATAVSAGTSIIGGAMSAGAQEDAANIQAGASRDAAQISAQQAAQIRNDLLPFMQAGQAALPMLAGYGGSPIDPARLNELTAPYQSWAPTQEWLESTPGYQFTRNQGLMATQNSFAAKGLGSSGNALRGAAEYATGLADQTYGNQFQRYLSGMSAYLTQNQQIFNMLLGNQQQGYSQALGRATLGANAAAQSGQFGTALAGQQGNALIGAGNALAAGEVGSANALAGGFRGAGSTLGQGAMLYTLLNQGSGSPGTTTVGMPGMGWNWSDVVKPDFFAYYPGAS